MLFPNATKGRTLELERQAYHCATATPFLTAVGTYRPRHLSTAVGCNDEQPDSGTRRHTAEQKREQQRRPLRLSRKIYTRAFTGLFRNLRMMGGAALFLLYFGTVWLNWGGHQAVWWNLPERKFFIFGATFWPQDFILLSGLLIIAAFGLFFITVYAGRVWCGYTCPQSVWTWIFMWCEKVTEGDRNQRIKLDKAPMSGNKFLRKFAKHTLWLLIGLSPA
jgi:hypothetical protein